jgi:hypothetical protein
MDKVSNTVTIELDQRSLLGFEDVPVFEINSKTLAQALDDLHNKIGEHPTAYSP